MIFTQEEVKRYKKIPSNYVGGKKRLLPEIEKIVEKIDFNTVYDGFCGSGSVSFLFNKLGKKTISSDIMSFSANTTQAILNLSYKDYENIPLEIFEEIPIKTINSDFFSKYENKIFTLNELLKIQNLWDNISKINNPNVKIAAKDVFYKCILNSIPNSNFTVYGKNLNKIRSTHDQDKSFWDEKWRDTTRKRRDVNNEIKLKESFDEFKDKMIYGFKLNNLCKNNFNTVLNDSFWNISKSMTNIDLFYLDPPYGKNSNNFYKLYRFFEDLNLRKDSLSIFKEEMDLFALKSKYNLTIKNMINHCNLAKYLLLSHNDNSYMNKEQVLEALGENGWKTLDIQEISLTYKFRSNKDSSRKGSEYLILCQNSLN